MKMQWDMDILNKIFHQKKQAGCRRGSFNVEFPTGFNTYLKYWSLAVWMSFNETLKLSMFSNFFLEFGGKKEWGRI